MAIKTKAININGTIYETMRNESGSGHGKIVANYAPDNSNVNNHGTYYLANNPQIYEIQRSNNFKFVVSDLNGIRRAGVLEDETGSYATFPGAEEILTLSVASAFVPSFSQNAIEIQRGNGTLKYAGVPKFQSGSIRFTDYIGAETKDILLAWQNLSYNVRTQKVGLASEYKKEARLIEYSPDYQEVRSWILHGCWISNLQFGEFNNGGNDKMETTASIEYDWAEIDITSMGN